MEIYIRLPEHLCLMCIFIMKLKNKCLAPYSSKWLVPVSQEIIQFICWNQELDPSGAVPTQWWDV